MAKVVGWCAARTSSGVGADLLQAIQTCCPSRDPLSAGLTCDGHCVRLMLSRCVSTLLEPRPTPNFTDLPEGGVQVTWHET